MSTLNSKKLFTKILDRIKIRNAASGGTDPSIVTTGDKYTWNNAIQSSEKGSANGVAPLNASSKIDVSYLPSDFDTSVVESYSTSKTYAVGDYVTYNNHIYKCTTAITTAEAWTAAHWTQITLADEITDLKDDLNDSISFFDDTNAESDKYINYSNGSVSSLSGQNSHVSDYIPVTAGLKIVVSKYATVSRTADSRGLAFYNSLKTYISGYQYNGLNNISITVPNNAKYIRLTYHEIEPLLFYSGENIPDLVEDILVIDGLAETVDTIDERTTLALDLTGISSTPGAVIVSSNGTVSTGQSENYGISDYIDIGSLAGGYATITSCYGSWFGFALYTATKVFISGYNSSASGTTAVSGLTINIPSNAKYVRFTLLYTSKPNITDYPIISNKKIVPFINSVVDNNAGVLLLNEEENYFSSLAVFQNIGIIGDSFASGTIYTGNTHDSYYDLSWGQILARECGVSVYNYSQGGLSTRTWLTNNARGLPKLLSDEAKDLYIIALGLNDGGISDYVGSISDIKEDYTQNPDTFYGNLARIIEQVQAHAPNAKIILSKMARYITSGQYPAIDDAIEDIGDHYSLPCINPQDDAFFKSAHFTQGLVEYHPTAILYGGMAKAYERLFSKATITYRSYFANYIGQ